MKLTLDVLELRWRAKKKKVSGVLISYFESCTRYSWVADEEKKVLGLLSGYFLSSLVRAGNSLFNFCKGGNLKNKVWETLL